MLQGNGDLQRHSDILGKRGESDRLRFGENRLRQQMSLDQNARFDSQLANKRNFDKRKLERHREVDLPESTKDAKSVSSETNNNRNSCPEMNESSASDSPQPPNAESTVDPHSLDFEIVLENNTGIVLAESFHSEQGQPEGSMYLGGYNHKKCLLPLFIPMQVRTR